jgi:hypothetical protein
VSGEGPAHRYPAVSFPEIEAVRLSPVGATASLVNLSSSGILVECTSRSVPGTALTVEFVGSFSPASVEGRVIRCEVKGISPDGSLRYFIGIAFMAPIPLPNEAARKSDPRTAPPSAPIPAAASGPAESAPAPRNRW